MADAVEGAVSLHQWVFLVECLSPELPSSVILRSSSSPEGYLQVPSATERIQSSIPQSQSVATSPWGMTSGLHSSTTMSSLAPRSWYPSQDQLSPQCQPSSMESTLPTVTPPHIQTPATLLKLGKEPMGMPTVASQLLEQYRSIQPGNSSTLPMSRTILPVLGQLLAPTHWIQPTGLYGSSLWIAPPHWN